MFTFKALIRQYGVVFILSFIAVYFFLAALQGNAGLYRLIQLNAEIEKNSEIHQNLVSEREKLENLTRRLSDDYLDLDLLDEQARKRLGLVREDEIIIQ